jgi:SRSO17 transposase
LAAIERRLAPCCVRAEPRQRALAYLRGRLSSAARQHRWQRAAGSGEATPSGFQHLLGRAAWEAEALRDALRRDIVQQLGDPDGVLVLAETGSLKEGRHSAGGARQDSGTAGRIAHGQMGVFLGDAGRRGQALRARELSGPQAWPGERARGRQAGIPDERRCATQPQLARRMLARALGAGVLATWGTGDRGYGDERRRRRGLEAPPQGSVLAVSGTAYVGLGGQQRQVKTILAPVPEAGWTRLRAGDGAQGPRGSAGCWRPLAAPVGPHWRRWPVGRRRVSAPTALRACVVFAPAATTRAEVVRVAGTRGAIESCREAATGEVGWEHDDVRGGIGWYRHITLARWALARWAVMRAGALAVAALKNTPRPAPERRSRAACKASRGLPCR